MIRHATLLAAGAFVALLLTPNQARAARTWDVILENPNYYCLVDLEGEDVTVKFYDRNRIGSYVLVEHALALDREGTWVIQGSISRSNRGGMMVGLGGKLVFGPGDRFFLFINKFTGATLAALANKDRHFSVRMKPME